MTISVDEKTAIAQDVRFEADGVTVLLTDGRRITTPLSWYPRLAKATPEQRRNWRFIGTGEGIHWPDVDEDLSIAGMLRGSPATGAEAAPAKM
jgi:Protein of unknown function (DUF2442)